MADKRDSRKKSTSGTQLTVISWKDERWSADEECLDALNKRLFGVHPRRKYFYEVCRDFVGRIFSFIVRIYVRLAKIRREEN